MNILCAGINHRTAHVDVRERFAVRESEMADMLARVREIDGVSGAVILSTCNRVELYAAGLCPVRTLDGFRSVMSERGGLEAPSITTPPRRPCVTSSALPAGSTPW